MPESDRPGLSRRDFLARAATGAALLAAAACDASRAVSTISLPQKPAEGARRVRFVYGTAITDNEVMRRPDIMDLVTAHCGITALAGPTYWKTLRPEPVAGSTDRPFDFVSADRCIQRARRSGLLVRGHTLLWHQLNPQWLIRDLNAANGERLLREHIATTVGRYREQIHSWDVVNEVVYPQDGRPDGLRNSIWMRALGPGHVDTAFRAAHEADPFAQLGYNEFGIHADDAASDEKRRVVLNHLTALLRNGTPVHYLGVQGHLLPEENFSDGKFGRFLREIRGMGLQVRITEMDVSDQLLSGDIATRDDIVADTYDRFLSVALGAIAIPFISTWGLSDVDSWLQKWPRPDGTPVRPLPFDASLRPKPAWDVILQHQSPNVIREPLP